MHPIRSRGSLTLHLVRHGETAGNAERRLQMPDVPLNDAGREQASAAAARLLGATRAEAILSSDYARALETAEIIGRRLGLPVTPEPALRERNFGIGRGRLYGDISEEALARWREPHYRIEQGESWADVHERMERFLRQLASAPPARELILVTHGGAMNVALRCLDGRPIDEFELVPLENCAVRTVVLPGDM